MSGRAEGGRPGGAAAGLFAGPLAWFTNTEANYALAGWVCASGIPIVPAVAAVALLVAAVGGIVSWRAWQGRRLGAPPGPEGGAPVSLLGGLGVQMAALFGLVILLQGIAGLVFDRCER